MSLAYEGGALLGVPGLAILSDRLLNGRKMLAIQVSLAHTHTQWPLNDVTHPHILVYTHPNKLAPTYIHGALILYMSRSIFALKSFL